MNSETFHEERQNAIDEILALDAAFRELRYSQCVTAHVDTIQQMIEDRIMVAGYTPPSFKLFKAQKAKGGAK